MYQVQGCTGERLGRGLFSHWPLSVLEDCVVRSQPNCAPNAARKDSQGSRDHWIVTIMQVRPEPVW